MNIAEVGNLVWSLFRILIGMALGLLIANILESLRFSESIAKLGMPLAKLAHLGSISASAFSLAALSSHAANGLLSENYIYGKISKKELIISNLFNSFPAAILHLPTIFFLTLPVLGSGAFIYTSLNVFAAFFRLGISIILGKIILPLQINYQPDLEEKSSSGFISNLKIAWKKFLLRLPKIFYYTLPFYILVYAGQKSGFFHYSEAWLVTNISLPAFIQPQLIGIIFLQALADLNAALGAVAAILQDEGFLIKDVIVALLVGNVLAAPMRSIRHQFPAYAGFYKPRIACLLVLSNQGLRIVSLSTTIFLYIIY